MERLNNSQKMKKRLSHLARHYPRLPTKQQS
jgi:hypothetical protein